MKKQGDRVENLAVEFVSISAGLALGFRVAPTH